MKKFSVVIPVFNEEEALPKLFERLAGIKKLREDLIWEFILVNDGSIDQTENLLDNFASSDDSVKILHLSRNFGQQIALTAGMDAATGDFLGVIDADLQDPPEMLVEMLREIESGNFDLVYGKREDRDGETWIKVFTAQLFYRLLSAVTQVPIPLDTGDFRVMSRKVLDAVRSMKENPRFLRGMFAWVGFRSKPHLYRRSARVAGKTNFTFRRMWRFALDALFSFSDIPLALAIYIGLAVVAIGALGVAYVLIQLFIFGNYIRGTSAVLLALLVIGGAQLVILGVMGQYIGRIFAQSKGRPLYLIRSAKNL